MASSDCGPLILLLVLLPLLLLLLLRRGMLLWFLPRLPIASRWAHQLLHREVLEPLG